ncbi:MAG: hypothetical protein MI685_01930 [Chlorobiales bacterium]|nr:hypothetical protein [Chlorobiales bacterium]
MNVNSIKVVEGYDFSVKQKELRNELNKRHEKRLDLYEVQGKNDGVLNVPGVDDESASEIEYEIRNAYKSDLKIIEQKGRPLLDEPHIKIKQLKEEKEILISNIDDVKEKKSSIAQDRKKTRLEEADKNNELNKNNVNDQKRIIELNWQDAQKDFKEVTDRIGRKQMVNYIKPAWIEWLILVFLGLCEIPLNYTVFVNFMLPKKETYMLSGLLVIAVPILAHHAGICWRQYEESKKYIYHLLIVIPLMIGLNVAVGILRTDYIADLPNVTPPELTNTLTFIMLSNILFLVGVIVSFLHHDKSQELTVATKNYIKNEKEYVKKIAPLLKLEREEQSKYIHLIKQIEEENDEERKRIESLVPDIEKKIADTVGMYDSILNVFKALEKEIDANYIVCVSRYRAANQRSRNNKERPHSWKKIASLEKNFVFSGIKEEDEN